MTAQAQIRGTRDIHVRRMDFTFSKRTPKHFNGNDPFLSAFLAAMSTVFPDGERFFIDSVRHYRERISDPDLQEAVRAFIGQEAHHGREHESFNQWLEDHGYPVSPVLERIRDGLDQARRNLSPRRQLALTIALEHFTAILAHQLLSRPAIAEALHPDVRELFIWHAVEETEHKAVAYDVYQAVDGGYFNRVLTMLEVTLFFVLDMTRITAGYMASENENTLRNWLGGLRWFWLNPGPMWGLIPEYLSYFRPGFHPWQSDNRGLIRRWQERFAGREI